MINEFIIRVSQIDIEDVKLKGNKGNAQKLDIVFDIDKTIIYKFVSNINYLLRRHKKYFDEFIINSLYL